MKAFRLDTPPVWSEFTPRSQKHQSMTLGEGFPAQGGPPIELIIYL
jgi:hypothetical protein